MFNKRLLTNIESEEEKFNKAFQSSPYAMILSRLNSGEILELNKGFLNISGYQQSEVIGKTSYDIHLWDNFDDRESVIKELMENGKVYEKEFQFKHKSGRKISGLFSAEIITVKNEKCILSSINDITERKLSADKIKENEARLVELNATKDKFFSIIAHDLRSPFNAIMGFSDLMIEHIEDKNYDSLSEYAKIIHTSSQRTIDLLTNLMDWANAQSGKMEFKPEFIELVLLINDVVEISKDAAIHKSITIVKEIPKSATIYADKFMMDTIFRNLISNAIKFTNEGGNIIIKIEIMKEEVLINIIDNGVGITKESINKLFRIDESFSTQGTKKEKGTGLGLILCKEFIVKHGGRIWVESEVNKGSKFCFTIPRY